MLFPYVVLYSLIYFSLLVLFFYAITTHVFVVELSSGIWWFALVLYLLLLFLCLFYMFHSRFKLFPLWEKLVTGAIVFGMTAASIVLGLKYRPFLNVQVNEKLGALISKGPFSSFEKFPDAKAEVLLNSPPALDQGALGTCWAYAGAGLLSMMHVTNQTSVIGCIEGIDVSKWTVSPQALVDLFPSQNKVGGAPVETALEMATRTGVPSLRCVPGYSSKWSGSIKSCACGAPQKPFCLLSTSGIQRHTKCDDGSEMDATPHFLGKMVKRVRSDDMEKVLSAGSPLIVWISFRPSGSFPLWTLAEPNGQSLKIVSLNYVARPRDEKDYRIFEQIGGHALLIVGYGTRDDGVKFWVVQNSWGQNWGNKGQLKIERGVNAWGIESFVYSLF
jgi:hypothetical protein